MSEFFTAEDAEIYSEHDIVCPVEGGVGNLKTTGKIPLNPPFSKGEGIEARLGIKTCL
jgi:hypothetical protein